MAVIKGILIYVNVSQLFFFKSLLHIFPFIEGIAYGGHRSRSLLPLCESQGLRPGCQGLETSAFTHCISFLNMCISRYVNNSHYFPNCIFRYQFYLNRLRRLFEYVFSRVVYVYAFIQRLEVKVGVFLFHFIVFSEVESSTGFYSLLIRLALLAISPQGFAACLLSAGITGWLPHPPDFLSVLGSLTLAFRIVQQMLYPRKHLSSPYKRLPCVLFIQLR